MEDRRDAEQIEKSVELVRQAKKGDQSAFMELYTMYYKGMYAYACYMLQHPQDAEDVVSDTIIAAFEGMGRLRDVYRFRQWIFKILSNQCKRRRKEYAENAKRMIYRGKIEEQEEDPLNQVGDGKDMAMDIAQREWVQNAFELLSEEEKYIVNSFLFAGYKGDEIAENLGIGASTFRSKYRRALLKMRGKLESQGMEKGGWL